MSPARIVRRRPIWALLVAIILASVLGALSAYLLTRQVRHNQVTLTDLCTSQNHSNETLRRVLLLSQAQGQRTTFPAVLTEDGQSRKVTLTFPTLKNGNQFYEDALKLTASADC